MYEGSLKIQLKIRQTTLGVMTHWVQSTLPLCETLSLSGDYKLYSDWGLKVTENWRKQWRALQSHGRQSTRSRQDHHAKPARALLIKRHSGLEKWFKPPSLMVSCLYVCFPPPLPNPFLLLFMWTQKIVTFLDFFFFPFLVNFTMHQVFPLFL